MNLRKVLIIFSVLSLELQPIKCDFFTSVERLIKLTTIEDHLVLALKRYLTKLQEKIDSLSVQIQQLDSHHGRVLSNPNKFVENPINAYLLIKYMSTHLEEILNIVSDTPDKELMYLYDQLSLPTSEDLLGASVAIGRLQLTYNLRADDLADGVIRDKKFDSTLNWKDCYDIAAVFYQRKQYDLSTEWLRESFKRAEDSLSGDEKVLFLSHISRSLEGEGKYAESLHVVNEMCAVDPDSETSTTMKRHLEEVISRNLTRKVKPVNLFDQYFNRMCGEKFTHTENLTCRYKHKENKFLYLARLKEEDVSLEPLIRVYHDVVSDEEISTLIKTITPRLKRAQVTFKPGKDEISDNRISEMDWLDFDDPTAVKLQLRALHMSSLANNTESLQVLNYGIGGQYDPHFDFLHKKEWVPESRMATVLFYLTTVEEGGGTVFPLADVKVEAVKGTAVVWYNLAKSGSKDYRTMHGACPVLLGSKWIGTIWIKSDGQSVHRPCELAEDKDDSYDEYLSQY